MSESVLCDGWMNVMKGNRRRLVRPQLHYIIKTLLLHTYQPDGSGRKRTKINYSCSPFRVVSLRVPLDMILQRSLARRKAFHIVLFQTSVAYCFERTPRTAQDELRCFLRMQFLDVLFVS